MRKVIVTVTGPASITTVRNTELNQNTALVIEGEGVEVSDGYHTMRELYRHRMALFMALIKIYDGYITPLGSKVKCWKSKLHSDGSMFEGYFIVGMNWPEFTKDVQISYHYKMEHWDKFQCVELPRAPEYDGHTADDVVERLMKL